MYRPGRETWGLIRSGEVGPGVGTCLGLSPPSPPVVPSRPPLKSTDVKSKVYPQKTSEGGTLKVPVSENKLVT